MEWATMVLRVAEDGPLTMMILFLMVVEWPMMRCAVAEDGPLLMLMKLVMVMLAIMKMTLTIMMTTMIIRMMVTEAMGGHGSSPYWSPCRKMIHPLIGPHAQLGRE